ncbi:MAG: hypothetical protein WBA67_05490 [Jannaschia sp.]
MRRPFTRFLRSEDGGISVEYSIWMVAMTLMLMMSADASMLLYKHAQLYDVSRDMARSVATGTLTQEEAAALLNRFRDPENYRHTVTTDGTFITTTVTVDFGDVLIFGGTFLTGRQLEGRVVMASEV